MVARTKDSWTSPARVSRRNLSGKASSRLLSKRGLGWTHVLVVVNRNFPRGIPDTKLRNGIRQGTFSHRVLNKQDRGGVMFSGVSCGTFGALPHRPIWNLIHCPSCGVFPPRDDGGQATQIDVAFGCSLLLLGQA